MTQENYDYTADDTWEMEASKSEGGGSFELCPQGNYPAKIVGLIDVGTHEETNDEGERYDSRKLILAVELNKKTSKEAKFVVSKLFTWSMRDNSNWYKLVSSLTGKKYAEGERFDPRKVLGMFCMANIVHVTSKKRGKEFHVLDSVVQYPEGIPTPDNSLFRPPIAWSVKQGDTMPALGWVPSVYFGTGMCSVEKIANMSNESRGFAKTNSPSKPVANPVADQVQAAIMATPSTDPQASAALAAQPSAAEMSADIPY